MIDGVDKKSGCPGERYSERAEARLRWLRFQSRQVAKARAMMAAFGRPMKF